MEKAKKKPIADNSLGGRIRKLRLMKGWSQDVLADQIMTKYSTISAYENNKKVPGIDVLSRLADVLDTSIDFLWRGNEVQSGLKKNDPGMLVVNSAMILSKYGFLLICDKGPLFENGKYLRLHNESPLFNLLLNIEQVESNRDDYENPDSMIKEYKISTASKINKIIESKEKENE